MFSQNYLEREVQKPARSKGVIIRLAPCPYYVPASH